MTSHRIAIRITWIGLLINMLLGCVKVIGGLVLHSKALLADGAHSLLDLLTDIVVLVVAVTPRLSSSREKHDYNLDSPVAQQDFIAEFPFESENLEETRTARESAAAKVPDIYKVDRTVVQQQLDQLAQAVDAGDIEVLTYQIRPGDSLWMIANRFNVSIKDLTRWNRINPNTVLHPGQQLALYLAQRDGTS